MNKHVYIFVMVMGALLLAFGAMTAFNSGNMWLGAGLAIAAVAVMAFFLLVDGTGGTKPAEPVKTAAPVPAKVPDTPRGVVGTGKPVPMTRANPTVGPRSAPVHRKPTVLKVVETTAGPRKAHAILPKDRPKKVNFRARDGKIAEYELRNGEYVNTNPNLAHDILTAQFVIAMLANSGWNGIGVPEVDAAQVPEREPDSGTATHHATPAPAAEPVVESHQPSSTPVEASPSPVSEPSPSPSVDSSPPSSEF